MKKYIFLFCAFNITIGQTNQINKILISPKKNGRSINILSDLPLNKSQVTGWYNESNSWYYMTIHNAAGDTLELEKTKIYYPISGIEAVNTGESLQIGFMMDRTVEDFEFYFGGTSNELLVALRFPLENVLAAMEMESSIQPNNEIKGHIKSRSWVKRFYIAGSSMIGIGILNSSNQKGWEIPIGFSLIIVAYFYEQFIIHNSK